MVVHQAIRCNVAKFPDLTSIQISGHFLNNSRFGGDSEAVSCLTPLSLLIHLKQLTLRSIDTVYLEGVTIPTLVSFEFDSLPVYISASDNILRSKSDHEHLFEFISRHPRICKLKFVASPNSNFSAYPEMLHDALMNLPDLRTFSVQIYYRESESFIDLMLMWIRDHAKQGFILKQKLTSGQLQLVMKRHDGELVRHDEKKGQWNVI